MNRLAILDSTNPEDIATTVRDFPPDKSLYLIASKSGGTSEVMACFEYLWQLAGGDGSRFVAVTDPGTSLEQLGRRLSFRKIFTADATVGGRYSALTEFGLLPGALLGIDLDHLIARAEWMQRQCSRDLPAARNPGIALGAFLGEAALAGRDKLTILAEDPWRALPEWIEQLIAESSGKDAKGLLPIPLEPLDTSEIYGSDRAFVFLRKEADGPSDTMDALLQAGFPVVNLTLQDPYEVGAEFYRWEVATATLCHVLGVNAFDQPNVQESKDRTEAEIGKYRASHALAEGAWDISIVGATLAPDDRSRLQSFLSQIAAGEYIAINAYVPRQAMEVDELQRLRALIRERTHVAVTAGFGPRFQHSTGQYHKGGPGGGRFIQIVTDIGNDMDIPGQGMSFGTLLHAQALGDYETLRGHGRRVLRIRLARPEDLIWLRKALS